MPKSTFKWVVGATVSAILLSGCGLLNQEKATEQIDPPKKLRIQKVKRKKQLKKINKGKQ